MCSIGHLHGLAKNRPPTHLLLISMLHFRFNIRYFICGGLERLGRLCIIQKRNYVSQLLLCNTTEIFIINLCNIFVILFTASVSSQWGWCAVHSVDVDPGSPTKLLLLGAYCNYFIGLLWNNFLLVSGASKYKANLGAFFCLSF